MGRGRRVASDGIFFGFFFFFFLVIALYTHEIGLFLESSERSSDISDRFRLVRTTSQVGVFHL